MPIYEYFCQDCENNFEIKVTIQEKERGLKLRCPSCGSSRTIQVLGNFFAFSKRGGNKFSGKCGPSSTPGCCG